MSLSVNNFQVKQPVAFTQKYNENDINKVVQTLDLLHWPVSVRENRDVSYTEIINKALNGDFEEQLKTVTNGIIDELSNARESAIPKLTKAVNEFSFRCYSGVREYLSKAIDNTKPELFQDKTALDIAEEVLKNRL
jgi:hypothetical protein